MKFLTALLLISTLQLPTAHAELTFKEHMTAMGYLLDEIWSRTTNPADYGIAADRTQELRQHMVDSIHFVPDKISAMDPDKKRMAMIEYHQFMSKVIYLLGTLESTLLKPEPEPVRELLGEISTLVGRAHGKYR